MSVIFMPGLQEPGQKGRPRPISVSVDSADCALSIALPAASLRKARVFGQIWITARGAESVQENALQRQLK